jgi:hypothetical protein
MRREPWGSARISDSGSMVGERGMVGRKLITLTVLAGTGALVAVLSGHLWGRYLQVTEAMEFGKTYDRYQASQGSADDAPIWRAGVREASALEE